MSRDIAPFGLRMPAELKTRLEVAAKENGRSLNAELVHRLEESLIRKHQSVAELTPADPPPRLPELVVTLDARGYPISWDEINAVLSAVKRAAGADLQSMNTRVITPALVSSKDRQPEYFALEKHLRALTSEGGPPAAKHPPLSLPAQKRVGRHLKKD